MCGEAGHTGAHTCRCSPPPHPVAFSDRLAAQPEVLSAGAIACGRGGWGGNHHRCHCLFAGATARAASVCGRPNLVCTIGRWCEPWHTATQCACGATHARGGARARCARAVPTPCVCVAQRGAWAAAAAHLCRTHCGGVHATPRAAPGIEPGTSRARHGNHATRLSSQCRQAAGGAKHARACPPHAAAVCGRQNLACAHGVCVCARVQHTGAYHTHNCAGAVQARRRVTAVGFEPTPLRTGA